MWDYLFSPWTRCWVDESSARGRCNSSQKLKVCFKGMGKASKWLLRSHSSLIAYQGQLFFHGGEIMFSNTSPPIDPFPPFQQILIGRLKR